MIYLMALVTSYYVALDYVLLVVALPEIFINCFQNAFDHAKARKDGVIIPSKGKL